MEEIKEMLKSIITMAVNNSKEIEKKVETTKGDKNMEKDEKKEVDNEKVDKRDIIRQIMAIAGKHEDNEDVRTIAKLAEKLGYDDSEKSADNEKEEDKEVKNAESEEDKEKAEDLKKDVKEDVENKCKNSKDDSFEKIMQIYNSSFAAPQEEVYTSRETREKDAEDYFRK